MRANRVIRRVALLALIAAASEARAQTPPSTPAVTAGWRDGFFIESETREFRLQIGALVQADGRFAPGDDAEAVTDTFAPRRLRPYLRGRLARHFEFYVNPDFAGGTVVVQDAYLDTVFTPALRLRVGKGKTPFGIERLQPASNITFAERALPTALVPNRDVGVQVLGDISGGLVSYAAGVMNGVADGASSDIDNSDSKDLAGRLVVRPFIRDVNSAWHGLSLAVAGSRGRQTGALALSVLRTAALQQPLLTYLGATADGIRRRYSPQISYTYRQFGGLAEYVHSQVPVRKDSAAGDIAHNSWQIAGSWVLSGEAATDGATGIRPRTNFDFGSGHWGAFQLAARYHQLTVDDRALSLGLVTAASSRKAEAWTLGLNWYLNPFIKYVVNFERTVFDGDSDGARRPEKAVVFRTQVNF